MIQKQEKNVREEIYSFYEENFLFHYIPEKKIIRACSLFTLSHAVIFSFCDHSQ